MSLNQSQAYAYSSEPRAASESKYRDDDGGGVRPYRNLMFDRRVVRGSTYAAQVSFQHSQEHTVSKKIQKVRRKKKKKVEPIHGPPEEDVPPVEGRAHIDVQTDNYLEELTDKLPEEDGTTQTDEWMDLPQLPLFIPTKTGDDKETQIEEGDLFDFDLEVGPILEVLVGKALEHSMNELLEEEELAAIREHQREFEHLRSLEIAEVKRLEAEDIRRAEEKARRMQQEKERLLREAEVIEKIAARKLAKDYLSDLHDSVFDSLMDAGHFYDPLVKEVQDVFIPSLLAAAAKKSGARQEAARIATVMIAEAQGSIRNRRQQIFEDNKAKAKAEAEARAKAEAEIAALAATATEEKEGDDDP